MVNHGWTNPKKHGYNHGTFLVGVNHECDYDANKMSFVLSSHSHK